MAQGRMIKKRISYSKKFAQLSTNNARLLYLMILPHLDVEGRIEADPTLLKSQVAPLLKFSENKIVECLEDMHKVGLIVLYKLDGDLYLECTRFKDFQVLRPDKEAESTIPAPSTGEVRELGGTTPALSKEKTSKVKTREEKEKIRHLDFIFLTKEEHTKLTEKFGTTRTASLIEEMNDAVGSKGYKYKSHYHTILTWARRKDKENPPAQQIGTAEQATQDKKRIRADYEVYLRAKNTPALQDLKKDKGRVGHLAGWLIDEILKERKA